MGGLFPIWAMLSGASPTVDSPSLDFVIVANFADAPSTLSSGELKKIFSMGTPTWSDGTPITLVLPPAASSEMEWLCTTQLRIDEGVFRRYTMEKAYREGLGAPYSSADRTDQLERIWATEGSISILPSGEEQGLLVLTLEQNR